MDIINDQGSDEFDESVEFADRRRVARHGTPATSDGNVAVCLQIISILFLVAGSSNHQG